MLGFFLTRYGMAAIALVLSLVGFQAWKLHYGYQKKQEGKTEVITQSKVEAKKLNEQVRKDRSTINPDTAASELLKRYRRD